LVLAGAIAALQIWLPRAPALPKPNGFDDFLAAARLVKGQGINVPDVPLADLARLVETNRSALGLASKGLGKATRFDVALSNPGTPGGAMDYVGFRKLACVFAEEAGVVGQTNPAAGVKICFEATRLGQGISRGAPFIVLLIGAACQRIVLDEAASLAPKLNAIERRQAAVAFRQILADAPKFEENIVAERAWAIKDGGLKEVYEEVVHRAEASRTREGVRARVKDVSARQAAFVAALEAAVDLTPPATKRHPHDSKR
jgi:hypothetical protein